jgi:acyl-CoA synthetase (AMP-forming)/AMP-acid ligase II
MSAKREKLSTTPPEKDVFAYFEEAESFYGDRTFLFDEERSLTFKETFAIVKSIAFRLWIKGIRAGDFVAFRPTRTLESALIFFALNCLKAVAVMTDAHFPVEDFLKKCDASFPIKTFITNEGGEIDISRQGGWQEKSGGQDVPLSFEPWPIGERELVMNNSTLGPDALSAVIFTSGSTGKSKAVMLSQTNFLTNASEVAPFYEYKDTDISIALLPIHHVFGFTLFVHALVSHQAVFFPERTDDDYVLACIEKYRITNLFGVPTVFLRLAQREEEKKYDVSSLRFGLIGGGPNTPTQFDYIEKTLCFRLVSVYGMSEFIAISCSPIYESQTDRSCGVGKFFPHTEGLILGEDGKEVPALESGEICVRGPVRMLGYYGDEKATSAAIDPQGYLHTGDLGMIDAKGILHLCGRKKDIIIRGGENISAGKIEEAILSLPEVFEAAALAQADPIYGEVPLAAAVLKNGNHLTPEEIRAKAAEHLAKNEVPVQVVILSSFPHTSSGKPDKKALREILHLK